jgi:hypothetical protein
MERDLNCYMVDSVGEECCDVDLFFKKVTPGQEPMAHNCNLATQEAEFRRIAV